jgi:3',5'-cyclic AMP phosphodiesterase CpdA
MPSHKEKSRPRVADLSALLEALSKADIDFIVVGGLAAVAQGAPITTMDMDIVHRQSKDNIEKLLAFLKKVEATLNVLLERHIVAVKHAD